MEVFAEGYAPREVQFAIVEQNPTMLNITLYKVRNLGNQQNEILMIFSTGCAQT